MSVLRAFFDCKCNQCSPVVDEMTRVVKHDKDGNEFIAFEKLDTAKVIASHGLVSDWSLNSLLKAGVNPNFPIHTGLNTRMEGISVVDSAVAIADELLAPVEESKESK